MDLGVYTKEREFRSIYASKFGSDRILRPVDMNYKFLDESDVNVSDYLVNIPEFGYVVQR